MNGVEYDQTILDGIKLIQEGLNKLSSGPTSFYLKEMLARSNMLFERFSPFQVGDRVALTKRLNGNDDGWSGCWWLICGAKGTVKEMGISKTGKEFAYEVIFDDEPDPKHTFHIKESSLRIIEK